MKQGPAVSFVIEQKHVETPGIELLIQHCCHFFHHGSFIGEDVRKGPHSALNNVAMPLAGMWCGLRLAVEVGGNPVRNLRVTGQLLRNVVQIWDVKRVCQQRVCKVHDLLAFVP